MNARLSLTLAVVALLALATFHLTRDVPLGRVEGVVLLGATGKPFADVDVSLAPVADEADYSERDREAAPDFRTHQRGHADAQGRFSFPTVAAGRYSLTAATENARGEVASIEVREGRVATGRIVLRRTVPNLQIAPDRPTVFTTRQTPSVPIQGFGTAGKRVRIDAFRLALSSVLSRRDGASALERLKQTWSGPQTAFPAPLPSLPADALAPLQIPVTKVDREGFFRKRVPLEAAKGQPGLYLVRFRLGANTACSWVLVTDLAIVVKAAPRGDSVAFVTDLTEGTPVAGVTVEAGGRDYQTDDEGMARFSGGDLVVARRGGDETVVSLSEGGWSENGGGFVVHTLTDRTVYRPGHRVEYKTIVRERDRDDPYVYRVAVGRSVDVRILDAEGAEVGAERKQTNAHGSFAGGFTISPEAGTGSFTIVATLAGEKHTADVPVSAYRKPEFDVVVEPERTSYVRGETITARVKATYYFGAPVAGATLRWWVGREADWSAEVGELWEELAEEERSGWPGGEERGYYGGQEAMGEVRLNERGEADLALPAAAREGAPQAETFTIHATVVDATHREQSADASVRVTAADLLLVVKPDGNVAASKVATTVEVQARHADGKPAVGQRVTVALAYEKVDPATEKSVYAPAGSAQTVRTDARGLALVAVVPPRQGELRISASAADAAGRSTQASASVWVIDASGEAVDAAYDDLSVLTDRRRYAPGQTARVVLNTRNTGQTALVTVEGDRLYEVWTVPLRSRSTELKVPVRAEYGPNVTLAACYVRDRQFVSGEAYLRVDRPDRKLRVTLTPERPQYEPGQTAQFKVRIVDRAGDPVATEFSLGVVDEAIYAIVPDDPQAVHATFFPRRGNRVQTRNSFAVAYLGDADKDGPPQVAVRRKFRDTAFWAPQLTTGADGEAQVAVSLPDNLTTWRATVHAVSDRSSAVGFARAKVTVTRPFFVRLDAPRFAVSGDRFRISGVVHNDTGAPQRVSVRLAAPGTLPEPALRTLDIPAGKIAKAAWDVEMGAVPETRLKVTAWTADERFSDAVETRLPVRAFGRETVAFFAGRTTPDRTGARGVTVAPDSIPGTARLTIRVTPGVGAVLRSALDYLRDYPYGCTEQTLSRFVPEMRVAALDRRLGGDERFGGSRDRTGVQVRDGLTRLQQLRHPDGGWGWWATDGDDPFMTAYVLYGLTAAREASFPVPERLWDGARGAVTKLLGKADRNRQPFLLYALARAGKSDAAIRVLGRLRSGDLKRYTNDSLAYLTLAGQAAGVSVSLPWGELQRRAHHDGVFVYWRNSEGRWDATDRMTTALALRAMLAVSPGDNRAAAAVRWLLAGRTDDCFGDTRDTSWTVDALVAFLEARPTAARVAGVPVVRLRGRPVRMDRLPGGERVARVGAAGLARGENPLQVTGGDGATFFIATLRQTIEARAGESEPLVPDGLVVARDFLSPKDGRVGTSFRSGDPVRVRLTLTLPRDLEYVMLEDAFPAGFEPTERGTAEIETSGDWGFWYSHVDVRDDRIAVFARRLEKGKHVFEYHLRAQTPGRYGVLPATLAPMYDSRRRAESRSGRVEVTP